MNKSLAKYATVASIAMLAGCGVFSNEPSSPDILETGVSVTSCSTADAQNASANAQMVAANAQMREELKRMGEAMNSGNWDSVKAAAPVGSAYQYDAILAQYPGHCGAQFGKAMVTLANLVRNPDIDNAMKDLNASDGSVNSDVITYSSYLNGSDEQVPVALFKVAQATHASRSTNVASLQNTIGGVVLSATDTAISYLENILEDKSFAFEFQIRRDDNTFKPIQIDNGDIGPALAALKYIKALEVVFASVEVDPSLNGTLDFLDTLANIEDADYDYLRPGQLAALNHAVSLTEKNSPFLTIKKDWRDRYSQIPELLKSAIKDIQTGLDYSISEPASSQIYDLYIVGDGPQADFTAAELTELKTNLDRVIKYLDGSVTIPYNKGTKSITVNIPNFFNITDGFQDLLPYHQVRPYSEWNDVVSAETTWGSWMNYDLDAPSGKSLADALAGGVVLSPVVSYKYKSGTYTNSLDYYGYAYVSSYSYGLYTFLNGDTVVVNDGTSSYTSSVYSSLYTSTSTCQVSYKYKGKSGAITVPACKASANSYASFASYVDKQTKAPFFFTDASGAPTFGLNPAFGADFDAEFEFIMDYVGVGGLAGKVVFPDPTFGGVFPGQTNETIWSTIASLELIEPRKACDAYGKSTSGYCYGDRIIPANPSDLDVLAYYFQ